MTDAVYRTVAAFAARLAALGTTEAVISPGSRSTPLTLCFDAQPGMRSWIQLDERSAGFFALGMGRASGRPAVLVCTSGTAAANYLPAVVESFHAGIPMIVCTADRPAELRGWGSPQTIDQVGLYGTAVRWSIDLPTPDEAGPGTAAGWAETAVASASGRDPGPVHLNWPLREPLEPMPTLQEPVAHRSIPSSCAAQSLEPMPTLQEPVASSAETGAGHADEHDETWNEPIGGSPPAETGAGHADEHDGQAPSAQLAQLAGIVAECERGVVVAGPWPGGGLDRERRWAAAAERFAAWAGWPLVGEPVAHVRGRSHPGGNQERSRCVVATADHLLADETLGEALRPDAAVLVGRTATTKPVRQWLERTRPRHVVLIDPEDRWKHAVFRLTGHVPASVKALSTVTSGAAPPGRGRDGDWLDTWAKLDRAARSAIGEAIDDRLLLSARAARVLAGALPADAVLVATNSLPVRDLDAFVFDTGSVTCCANRGAAGIDGSASTALGIAAADPSRVVALYTGDLALLHDLSGLAAAARLGLHLIVVCVDNDGGEIFSLLPVADRVPARDFERLFRTPHGLDLCGLDGFAGIRVRRVKTAAKLDSAVRAAAETPTPGVDLLVVAIDRDEDVAQRRALTAAAQQAAQQALDAVEGRR